MPDNTRPPRHLVDPDPRPTLGVRAVMLAVEDVARAKALVGARVGYKRNGHGEHVVALIFPAQPASPPPPADSSASGTGSAGSRGAAKPVR